MESFFTKTSSEREVAHLYEHIYLAELDNNLISDGYLPFLDYIANGESLRGEIEANIRTFSPTLARKMLEILQETDKKLRFTSDKIDRGLAQIAAEKRERVLYVNPEIVDQLSNIRRRKWREGKAIDIDLASDDAESAFVFYKADSNLRFYNIPIEVSYKGAELELGMFLCRIVMEILTRMLMNEFACCYDGASDEISEKHVSLATMLLKIEDSVLRKEMIEKRAEELLKTLKKAKNLRKFQKQLKDGPYIPIAIENLDEKLTLNAEWSKYANPLKISKALDKIKIRALEITTEDLLD